MLADVTERVRSVAKRRAMAPRSAQTLRDDFDALRRPDSSRNRTMSSTGVQCTQAVAYSRLIDSPKKSEPVACAPQEFFSFFKNDAKSKRGLQLSTRTEVARPAGFQTSLSVRQ